MMKNTTSRGLAAMLRTELALLVARYDSGAMPPAVYTVIRSIEQDIAWLEQADRRSA